MANYLKQENQLIVWPVLKEYAENDMFLSNIGMRTRYDMSTKELLDICLEAYKDKVDKEKNYILVLKRVSGDVEISLDQTVKEAGLRNGDYLEIIVA